MPRVVYKFCFPAGNNKQTGKRSLKSDTRVQDHSGSDNKHPAYSYLFTVTNILTQIKI